MCFIGRMPVGDWCNMHVHTPTPTNKQTNILAHSLEVVQSPTLTTRTHKTAELLSCRSNYINLLSESKLPSEITGETMQPLEVSMFYPLCRSSTVLTSMCPEFFNVPYLIYEHFLSCKGVWSVLTSIGQIKKNKKKMESTMDGA